MASLEINNQPQGQLRVWPGQPGSPCAVQWPGTAAPWGWSKRDETESTGVTEHLHPCAHVLLAHHMPKRSILHMKPSLTPALREAPHTRAPLAVPARAGNGAMGKGRTTELQGKKMCVWEKRKKGRKRSRNPAAVVLQYTLQVAGHGALPRLRPGRSGAAALLPRQTPCGCCTSVLVFFLLVCKFQAVWVS